eukprot:scaffold7783_cov85-Skeletonema_dohrnii-CCMP3373.AAC.7
MQCPHPPSNLQLALHRALQNNATLGSIKLLMKGNPPAVQSPDNSGLIPLHVACVHHDSVKVVQFLIGLDATTLDAVDREGNTALHLACRNGRHDNIALLLDKFDAVSVSKRNARGKLPIDLLWESNEVEDRESIEYTECVFRLLKATLRLLWALIYRCKLLRQLVQVRMERRESWVIESIPMNFDVQKQSLPAACPSQSGNGNKRKFIEEE